MSNIYGSILRINRLDGIARVEARMRLIFSLLAMSALTVATLAQKRDRDLAELAAMMTGSFDTFEQVDADEEADSKYRHIRALLHVTPIVLPEFKDGFAFYVENQTAEQRTKPYRQRVYFLSWMGGKINLSIFRIGNESEFVNAHKKKASLRTLTFGRLTKEEGCDLTYERVGESMFKGGNGGGANCRSNLRGATRTNSESEISKGRWVNLDQGFDDAGGHKWGPPPGTVGHIFIKRK